MASNEHLNLRNDFKQNINFLRNVLEFSPDAIILIETEGKIVEINQAIYKIFELKNDFELINKFFIDFMVETNRQKIEEDFAYTLLNGELHGCEYLILTGEGNHRHIECSYKRLDLEGFSPFVIAIIRDITKRKIDDSALFAAKEKAEIADKLKTAFLANMSHEIRTPVNAILGFSDLLSDDYCTEDEKKEFIDIINSNGQQLLNLINDIIDVAKIESGQLKISKSNVSLKNLFDEVYETFREKLRRNEKSNLKLSFILPQNLLKTEIITDQFRLNQILANLLGNAMKFTEEGEIEFGVNIQEGKYLDFYVRDTGIGMNPEETEVIFDRFRQLDESQKLTGSGTGLGLTISKSLVELLGGRIFAQSKPDEGSIFHFTLPLIMSKESEMVNSNNPETPYASLKSKRILVVEDSETNYLLVELILKKIQVEVIWVLNGLQAVNICKNQSNIDLVLMDINLPIMNGYEATSQIKSFNPGLPIIALTAYAMAGEREKSLSFGCDEYISKPINAQLLYKTIAKFVK